MTSKKALTGAALAQALLRPKKIALVGISDDPSKTADDSAADG